MPRKNKHTVILADDHPLVLRGLCEIIEEDDNYEIIDKAADGEQALLIIEKKKPDIAVLDIDMPKLTGLQIAENIKNKNLPTKVIFLTMHNKESIFNRAMSLGAYGFLMKDSALVEIIEALSVVTSGKKYISKSLTDLLINRVSTQPVNNPSTKISALTSTELKIVKLISQNKSSKEIAEDLSVSIRTVETHRSNMCSKLELYGTNSLLKFALENKELLK
jgi:DNA-binding NarL/FixJ family response regulator